MTKNHKITFVEKTISTIIIIILFLILIIILSKQSSYDIKNFGMVSENSDQQFNLKNISPKKFLPDKFKLYLSKEIYDKDNLHEKINGKANLYLDNGFTEMLSQRFAAKNDNKLWFEIFIYNMSSGRNSFSVFSQQRRSDADIIQSMNMAYKTRNALFISIGNYYIEILGSIQSNFMNKAMFQTGQKIESFFKSTGVKDIPELSLFDKKILVKGSENLYQSDAFGYHALTNIFTAKYTFDKKTTTVFFSKKNDKEIAQKEAMGYVKFLLDNGGTKVNTSIKDIILIDLFGSYETIFTYDKFLLGVHGAFSKNIAEKLSIKILKTMKKENP